MTTPSPSRLRELMERATRRPAHRRTLVNHDTALIQALEENERLREALTETTDALIEMLPRINGALRQDEVTCRGAVAGVIAKAQAALKVSP